MTSYYLSIYEVLSGFLNLHALRTVLCVHIRLLTASRVIFVVMKTYTCSLELPASVTPFMSTVSIITLNRGQETRDSAVVSRFEEAARSNALTIGSSSMSVRMMVFRKFRTMLRTTCILRWRCL